MKTDGLLTLVPYPLHEFIHGSMRQIAIARGFSLSSPRRRVGELGPSLRRLLLAKNEGSAYTDHK